MHYFKRIGKVFLLSLGSIVKRKVSDDVIAAGFKIIALISLTTMAGAGFDRRLRVSNGIVQL
jgi:predicted histidine transporter YuiF (NhaC family)